MEHRCERCDALFKGPSWKIAKARHDARKNPCDRPKGVKYIKEAKPVPDVFRHRLGSVDVTNLRPPLQGRMTQVVPELLRQVFARDQNVCIVWPNIHKEELIVFLAQDADKGLRRANLDELTLLVVTMVHQEIFPTLKEWPRYAEFKDWLWRTTLEDMENDRWTGDMSKKCEYYQSIRTFLKDFFGRYPGKRRAYRNLHIAAGYYDPQEISSGILDSESVLENDS